MKDAHFIILQGEKTCKRICILSQGGRAVLFLCGYTNQQPDGLSFPDDITEPDITKVAAVTLEVMSLRTELDMLIKVSAVCFNNNNNSPPTTG